MPRKNQPKRTRRTKEQVDLYGTNLRKLLHEYPVIKKRLLYLCDFLFDGSHHEMAAALGVCYRQLRQMLNNRTRFTIAMAAQIVSRLGVNAEWLLCGTGDMFVKPATPIDLPKTLRSSFQIFDAINQFDGIPDFALPLPAPAGAIADIAPFVEAGKAVYRARINKRSVGFFLGSDSFRAAQATTIMPFFRAQYANLLMATAEYAQQDIRLALRAAPDMNAIALEAAKSGIGYGEAIGLFALPKDIVRDISLLVSLYDTNTPALVSAEIGELLAHNVGPVRGAEIAAAVGAAAYVDLLIFTEQLRNFVGETGGVFIVAGEHRRGVRFFLQRLEALTAAEPRQDGFTLVVFAPKDELLQNHINKLGGHAIFLDNPTTASLLQLLQACDDVFAGKIK